MSVSSLLAAALLQTAAPAPDLSWLAGYWLDCSDGREASETWSDPRAGLIVGHSVTVRNGRSGFESARIAPLKDGGLAYFAQPDGAPATPFRLIDSGPQRAVFANPDNDFPHRIIYDRAGDVLTARIEGADDDENRSVQWRFNRAELNARCPN
ncbi:MULTISPECIES: DUF6265 family protein [Brevundimonas]|uniref:DUF6265 family protein n=1 Tax=Brevundimonas TaxID=41275 RepID=UPI001903F820|nr:MULTISPECIES: DUF6265 family protein [Brevundimonas]MDA0744703.1 DUF6265 family protein [Pseudomonadota bacterium]MBK1968580.1 hypothetical protein [Brevundimonas diminuta]MBK1975800.1 hypothetical protein [Brevundimonas diminuta]MDA1321646.1 DUF6265 family protein [Pseudomonadota bacterium]MDM8352270.1 DUF6265 family protein [Brevundimonas diminuta]